MVVITKVELLESDENPTRIMTHDPVPILDYDGGDAIPIGVNVHEECVYGEEFRSMDGSRVILGMTQEVSKLLGEPFKVIKTIRTTLDERTIALRKAEEALVIAESYNLTMSQQFAILEDEYAELEGDSIRISELTFIDKVKLLFKK